MSFTEFNPDFDFDFDFDFSQPLPVVQPVDNTMDMDTMPVFDQALDFFDAPGFESIDPMSFVIEDFVDFVQMPFDEGGTVVAAEELYMQDRVPGTMQDIQAMQAEPPGDQAMVPSTEEDLESDSYESLFCGNSPPEPPTISGETPDSATGALEREINAILTDDQSHSAPAPAPAATEGISQLDGFQFPTPSTGHRHQFKHSCKW